MSESGLNFDITFNPEGWGPISGEKLLAFDEVPYAHFDKKDKCNRAADFTAGTLHYSRPYNPRYRRDDGAVNAEFSYRHDAAEDSTFQLVDSTKASTKKYTTGKKNWQQPGGRGGRGAGGRGGRGMGPRGNEPFIATSGGRGGKGFKAGFKRYDRKVDRVASLVVGADWELVDEFDLAQLVKLVANPPKETDLLWAGHLDQYDDTYDKLSTRTARPLKKVENKIFYAVTTSEDPILNQMAQEGQGNVFATDAILSQIMAAPRSVYSWDLVVQKQDGVVYLDKREGSAFDYLTVSETAREPPSVSDEIDIINHPEKLSLEATMINQNFSQQILKEDSEVRKTFEPNPFFEDDVSGTEPASIAYRYRKFSMGNLNVITRCELHGWLKKREEEVLMTAYALNEWDSKYADGVVWRQKIDQQKGAVLATELKNNSCKLAKWTAQSIIAGADQMKLGYVSRVAVGNAYDHTILATQFFKPKELAQQINLSLNNIWGIVKMLGDLLMSKEDGKYVLLKDPNKPTLRLYSVPVNTFEEDYGEEETTAAAPAGEEEDA